MGRTRMSRLHREDYLLRLAPLVMEVEPSVDALVRSLLFLYRPCADQAERPELELVRVRFCQGFCIGQGNRLPDYPVGYAVPEAIPQSRLDKVYSERCDVNTNPAAVLTPGG